MGGTQQRRGLRARRPALGDADADRHRRHQYGSGRKSTRRGGLGGPAAQSVVPGPWVVRAGVALRPVAALAPAAPAPRASFLALSEVVEVVHLGLYERHRAGGRLAEQGGLLRRRRRRGHPPCVLADGPAHGWPGRAATDQLRHRDRLGPVRDGRPFELGSRGSRLRGPAERGRPAGAQAREDPRRRQDRAPVRGRLGSGAHHANVGLVFTAVAGALAVRALRDACKGVERLLVALHDARVPPELTAEMDGKHQEATGHYSDQQRRGHLRSIASVILSRCQG